MPARPRSNTRPRSAGTDVDVSPAPGHRHGQPAHADQLPRRARRRDPRRLGRRLGAAARHAGHLRAYSQGDGASFAPDAPFDAGERVTVQRHDRRRRRRAGRPSASASTRPTRRRTYRRVPQPAGGARRLPELLHDARRAGAGDDRHRRPTATRRPATIFITNGPGPGQYGPLIYTPAGPARLVRAAARRRSTAENLNVQSYQGRRVLTWWKGRVLSLGFGQGEDIVMNSHYQDDRARRGRQRPEGRPARVPARPARRRLHHRVQPDPLRPAPGAAATPTATIIDTAIQEIDMQHGPRALGMAQPRPRRRGRVRSRSAERARRRGTTSTSTRSTRSRTATCCISARSTWAGVRARRRHAARSSGASAATSSSFKMGPGTKTAWQHDGRMLPDGDAHVLRRRLEPADPQPVARRCVIALDLQDAHARASSKSYTHRDPPLLAASQGNMQTLRERQRR